MNARHISRYGTTSCRKRSQSGEYFRGSSGGGGGERPPLRHRQKHRQKHPQRHHPHVLRQLVVPLLALVPTSFHPVEAFPTRRHPSSSSSSLLSSTWQARRPRHQHGVHRAFFSPSSSTTTIRTTATTTARHLFFRTQDADSSSPSCQVLKSRRRTVSDTTIKALQSRNVTFPFEVQWEDPDDEDEGATRRQEPEIEGDETHRLILRFMTPDDLTQLLPMCIDEFGTGPTTTLQEFPLLQPTQIPKWWDRFLLEPMVRWALLAKLQANHNHIDNLLKHNQERVDVVQDPAMLVLCRRGPRRSIFKHKDKPTSDGKHKDFDTIVGMVELSLQPIEYDKNPPAFPVPRWMKQLYSRVKNLGHLEGWVTNVLVPPTARGLGYSKILMWATEGIARKWDCHYIYLHADADIQSGRIPQTLYERLGYTVVEGNRRPQRRGRTSLSSSFGNTIDEDLYAWAGDDSHTAAGLSFLSSIRMVQGVPLLCYCKNLKEDDGL